MLVLVQHIYVGSKGDSKTAGVIYKDLAVHAVTPSSTPVPPSTPFYTRLIITLLCIFLCHTPSAVHSEPSGLKHERPHDFPLHASASRESTCTICPAFACENCRGLASRWSKWALLTAYPRPPSPSSRVYIPLQAIFSFVYLSQRLSLSSDAPIVFSLTSTYNAPCHTTMNTPWLLNNNDTFYHFPKKHICKSNCPWIYKTHE